MKTKILLCTSLSIIKQAPSMPDLEKRMNSSFAAELTKRTQGGFTSDTYVSQASQCVDHQLCMFNWLQLEQVEEVCTRVEKTSFIIVVYILASTKSIFL